MAVERFMANQDVVYELCQHFSLLPRPITAFASLTEEGEYEASVNRMTLASMARTYKALSVPASEQLWEVLHVGLLPLVKTFSGLKRGEREGFSIYEVETYLEPYYDLDGSEVPAEEWERFDRLAARVRCLRYSFHSLDPFEPSLVAALVSHCEQTRRAALLPNLRALHWPESLGDENALRLFGLLCAADSLRFFAIADRTKYGFSGGVSKDISVLAGAQSGRGLAHLCADCFLPHACVAEIATLRALRTLRLVTVEGSAWLQLGALPFLADLSVGIVSDFDRAQATLTQGMHEGHTPGFPALQRLKVSGPPDLLTTISSPSFTALELITCATRADELLHLLEKTFALPVLKALREVHLTIQLALEPDEERMECAFADLARALFPLGTLEDVSIRVAQHAISFSDEDVQRVKAAWPHLISLAVSFDALDHLWQPAEVEIRRPSFRRLVEYALSRPGLRTLDVEVAGVSDDDVAYLERAVALRAADDRQEHPRAGLKWLTFARGDYRRSILLPRDLDRLASALSALFPGIGGLERAGMREPGGRKWYIMWSQQDLETEVGRLLEKLECLRSS